MPEIDMTAIREALARRGMGGAPAGGGTTPMSGQLSAPAGSTPTGGPNVPTPPAPTSPTPPPAGGSNVAPRTAAAPMAKAAQAAQGPNFDGETKMIAKALVTKLIKYL